MVPNHGKVETKEEEKEVEKGRIQQKEVAREHRGRSAITAMAMAT